MEVIQFLYFLLCNLLDNLVISLYWTLKDKIAAAYTNAYLAKKYISTESVNITKTMCHKYIQIELEEMNIISALAVLMFFDCNVLRAIKQSKDIASE